MTAYLVTGETNELLFLCKKYDGDEEHARLFLSQLGEDPIRFGRQFESGSKLFRYRLLLTRNTRLAFDIGFVVNDISDGEIPRFVHIEYVRVVSPADERIIEETDNAIAYTGGDVVAWIWSMINRIGAQ